MRLGILASGQLGFMVLEKLSSQNYPISFVCTDGKSGDIINFVDDKSIPLFIGNPRNGATRDFINNKNIDILLSINYIFLIEEDLIQLPKIVSINFHGSLLPKYRGRTPHIWAIINNEKETGITAHVIEKGCDTGDIIKQKKIEIGIYDTGADILSKFNEIYPDFIVEVIEVVRGGKFSHSKQDESLATFFGKRTPDDGEINWNWSKERIRNWVRAQASPYPGAFSYYDNKKVIFDNVEFSDYGFHFEDPNGLILSEDPLIVKTPNGAVLLNKIRESIEFEKGKILGK